MFAGCARTNRDEIGMAIADFCTPNFSAAQSGLFDQIGSTPIPPYLRRDAEDDDKERYQTMFAEKRGAVAASSTRRIIASRG